MTTSGLIPENLFISNFLLLYIYLAIRAFQTKPTSLMVLYSLLVVSFFYLTFAGYMYH